MFYFQPNKQTKIHLNVVLTAPTIVNGLLSLTGNGTTAATARLGARAAERTISSIFAYTNTKIMSRGDHCALMVRETHDKGDKPDCQETDSRCMDCHDVCTLRRASFGSRFRARALAWSQIRSTRTRKSTYSRCRSISYYPDQRP